MANHLECNFLMKSYCKPFGTEIVCASDVEATFEGKRLRIWDAEMINVPTDVPPGTVMEVNKLGIEVATGDKVLRIDTLQLPGGRAMSAAEFLNAYDVLPGETVFLTSVNNE